MMLMTLGEYTRRREGYTLLLSVAFVGIFCRIWHEWGSDACAAVL